MLLSSSSSGDVLVIQDFKDLSVSVVNISGGAEGRVLQLEGSCRGRVGVRGTSRAEKIFRVDDPSVSLRLSDFADGHAMGGCDSMVFTTTEVETVFDAGMEE
jgi:hypothetical protein